MEGKSHAKFQRGSARKMRRVAALIRGMNVDHATAMLRHMPQKAAKPLAAAIQSARANAMAVEGTAHHHAEDFVVADVTVDGGPIAKRIRPVSMGRAYRIRKRYHHLKVVVSDEVEIAGRRGRRKAARVADVGAPDAEQAKED